MSRTDIPPAWDERAVLATFLDYVRATVHAKCEHLAEADARRAPLPGSPLMTLSGLVSHVRWVEYFWFQVMLLGEEDHGPWTEEDPDPEMRIAVEVPIARLLEEYEAQCARYRELVASLDLDTPSKRPLKTGERVTLRWVLFHLIEETARHNGHIDILRELADGVTGTDRPAGRVDPRPTPDRILVAWPQPIARPQRRVTAGRTVRRPTGSSRLG